MMDFTNEGVGATRRTGQRVVARLIVEHELTLLQSNCAVVAEAVQAGDVTGFAGEYQDCLSGKVFKCR